MVEDVSPEQIKRIAEKALVIERYVLERAWGICYAAVAAEIVLIPFLPLIILVLGLSAGYFLVVAIVANTAVSIVGATMVAWVFKKAYNSMLVRREIVDSIWTKWLRPSWIVLVWTAYYLPILAAIFLLRQDFLVFRFGLLATTVIPLFFVLKGSFPERLPQESTAVVSALTIYTLGGFVVSLLKANAGFYLILWVIFLVVLILASAHARRRKPPISMEDPQNW
ncbi:MAG: hypothetical protein ABSF65_11085 [Candidatus Bathyarchaeia archaeon]|jgi:hypothetical protein